MSILFALLLMHNESLFTFTKAVFLLEAAECIPLDQAQ